MNHALPLQPSRPTVKPWRLLFGALLGAVAIALLFNEDFLRISGLVYTVAALVAGGVIGSPLSRR